MSIVKLITDEVIRRADMEERVYLNHYVKIKNYAGVAEIFDVNRTTAMRKIRKALVRVHGENLPINAQGRMIPNE
jgi:hypothetical protein